MNDVRLKTKKLHKSLPLMPSPYSCNKRKGYTVQTIRKFDSRGALRCLHTCAILKFSVKVFINMIDIPLENTKYVSWSVISYHPKIVLSRDVWWGKLGPQTGACLSWDQIWHPTQTHCVKVNKLGPQTGACLRELRLENNVRCLSFDETRWQQELDNIS